MGIEISGQAVTLFDMLTEWVGILMLVCQKDLVIVSYVTCEYVIYSSLSNFSGHYLVACLIYLYWNPIIIELSKSLDFLQSMI